MLVPVCGLRLPVQLGLKLLSAKNLPVMNKSINSTDAYVEIRYMDLVEKTEVITSLNPSWDLEEIKFETDEKELFENRVQFRVMDHDTYTTNDAIGRVHLDVNVLVERMRVDDQMILSETLALPIYDTLNGLRGELLVQVELELLVHMQHNNYVRIISGFEIPSGMFLHEIHGLLSVFKTIKDPDYDFIDRIRTPRATNEARQSAIRDCFRSAALIIAEKAYSYQCNLIVGFQEALDVEGSSSGLFTVRIFGTALRFTPKPPFEISDHLEYPILSLPFFPLEMQIGIGAMVAARCVRILEDSDDADDIRKKWWREIRYELFQQAVALGCNAIIGYTEQFNVLDGVAILGCTGTAIVTSTAPLLITDIAKTSPIPKRDFLTSAKDKRTSFKELKERSQDLLKANLLPIICRRFHAPTRMKTDIPAKLQTCTQCRDNLIADFVLSTAVCPPPIYCYGARHAIQVSATRKILSTTDEKEEFANELSTILPFADHSLLDILMGQVKSINASANAIFDVRYNYAISDELLVVVITGTLVRLSCIPKDDMVSPSMANVLSLSNLQKYNDARRFSWGTVRDAIRFKTTVVPNVTLKILNLRPPNADENDEGNAKTRLRLATLVDKMRRRQHEKEYLSHVVFERQASLSVGVLENSGIASSNQVAGIHISPNMSSFVLTREAAESSRIISRWSDVYIKEDLNCTIKDSTSVDGFATAVLDERLLMAKSLARLGGEGCVASNMHISCPQLDVVKDHAHTIIFMSFDINAPC